MHFDLTDLRLFLTIVEEGSITAGARAMNMALAAASERVTRMELALGMSLLERRRRGVQPTPAGNAVVRHARLIVSQVESMRGELREFGAGIKGRIRLLSNSAGLYGFLPRRLSQFLVENPALSIDIRELPSSEIALLLAQGKADLGIVADIADLTLLQPLQIGLDRLEVFARKDFVFKGRVPVTFAEIVDESFVGLLGGALEAHLEERAARLGRQMNFRARLRSIEDVGMLVEAGVGIAILSETAVEHLKGFELRRSSLREEWGTRRLYFCVRDLKDLTPQAKILASELMRDSWKFPQQFRGSRL
jgi:DNA-binding transcriptional LysR family regulator